MEQRRKWRSFPRVVLNPRNQNPQRDGECHKQQVLKAKQSERAHCANIGGTHLAKADEPNRDPDPDQCPRSYFGVSPSGPWGCGGVRGFRDTSAG